MHPEEILEGIRAALRGVTSPRLYQTERGYQGEFLVQLAKILPVGAESNDGVLLEQEYQKRLRDHGISTRPDVIIHEPFDELRHAARTQGNFAVMELKRRATDAAARQCLANLYAIMDVLHYPLGVFLNIASDDTKSHLMNEPPEGRVAFFAVDLNSSGEVEFVESAPKPDK